MWKILWSWLSVGEIILQKIWQGIIWLTPFGRMAAEQMDIHYMLVVGLVCAVNELLFFWLLSDCDGDLRLNGRSAVSDPGKNKT